MVSRSLRETSGALDDIVAALGDLCVAVWDGMPAHTPRDAVLEAAQKATWQRLHSLVEMELGTGDTT